jgi:hypothetical protein
MQNIMKCPVFNVYWIYDVNNNITAWKSLRFHLSALFYSTWRSKSEGTESYSHNAAEWHPLPIASYIALCTKSNKFAKWWHSYRHKSCFVCYTSYNFAVILGRVDSIPPSHSEAPGSQTYPRQQCLDCGLFHSVLPPFSSSTNTTKMATVLKGVTTFQRANTGNLKFYTSSCSQFNSFAGQLNRTTEDKRDKW